MTLTLREIMPLIVLVTLGAILAAAICEQWTANEDAEQDRHLEYLECRPLDSFGTVEAVTGPAEIFSYGGSDWLRAKGVGEITVRTDRGTETWTVSPAKLGLILLTGQSNSVMFTNPSNYTAKFTIDPGRVFYFGTPDPTGYYYGGNATPEDVASCGIIDLVAPDGSLRLAQMYPTFCQDWLKETGKRILILNTGISGRAIAQWDIPSGECSAWMTTATAYLKAAVEEDGNIELEPIAALWSQGESDARYTVEHYYDRLKTLVSNLENGAWGYSYPMVLTTLPRLPDISGPIAPAIAQERLAQEDPTFVIASSIALEFGPGGTPEMREDRIHYTQKTFGWLGEAFARSLGILEGYQPVSETIVFAKDLGTVEELPQTVTAYGTSGAAFELQVSWTESEGSYTGELSGNPAGTRIMEGLAASATLAVEEEEEAEPETP